MVAHASHFSQEALAKRFGVDKKEGCNANDASSRVRALRLILKVAIDTVEYGALPRLLMDGAGGLEHWAGKFQGRDPVGVSGRRTGVEKEGPETDSEGEESDSEGGPLNPSERKEALLLTFLESRGFQMEFYTTPSRNRFHRPTCTWVAGKNAKKRLPCRPASEDINPCKTCLSPLALEWIAGRLWK